MKVLDSTFLIDLLRGKEKTKSILNSGDILLTTQINMYEVIIGIFEGPASPVKQLQVRELFEDIRVLQLDDKAILKSAEICAALNKKGSAIGDCDCLTAGIALSNGVNCIITNDKHFQKIPEITAETY